MLNCNQAEKKTCTKPFISRNSNVPSTAHQHELVQSQRRRRSKPYRSPECRSLKKVNKIPECAEHPRSPPHSPEKRQCCSPSQVTEREQITRV